MRVLTWPYAPQRSDAAAKGGHPRHGRRLPADEEPPASPRLAYLTRKALGPTGLERLSSAPDFPSASTTAAGSPRWTWTIKAGGHMTDEAASDAGLMRLFASARRSTDLEAARWCDAYPTDLTPKPTPAAASATAASSPTPCCAPSAGAAEQAVSAADAALGAFPECPSLDLELSPEEAQWLVRPHSLLQAALELAPAHPPQPSIASALRCRLGSAAGSTAAACSRLAGKASAAVRRLGSTRMQLLASKALKLKLACVSLPAIK